MTASGDPMLGGSSAKDGEPSSSIELCRSDLHEILRIDEVGETHILTNLVTADRKSFAGGAVPLVFAQGGISCSVLVVAQDGAESIFDIEALFRYTVWEVDATGMLFVEDKQSTGGHRVVPWQTILGGHRLATATFRIGHSSAHYTMEIVVMVRPRSANSRVYWNLDEVCKFLGVQGWAYSSRWVGRSWERWANALEPMCGLTKDLFLFSNNASAHLDSAPRKNRMAVDQRCLPFHSASTFCLGMLLARWCGVVPQSGGLRTPETRSAAQHLLSSIVSVALGDGEVWTVDIVVCTQ